MAKILLPFLIKCSFLMPRCSSFMLLFSIECIFFSLQKVYYQEFVSACIFSTSLLSLLIMFEKLSAVSGVVFLTLWTIFLTLLRRLTLLVRSLVPTWTINDYGFPSMTSSILSTISLVIAPGIFKNRRSLTWIILCRWYYSTWNLW